MVRFAPKAPLHIGTLGPLDLNFVQQLHQAYPKKIKIYNIWDYKSSQCTLTEAQNILPNCKTEQTIEEQESHYQEAAALLNNMNPAGSVLRTTLDAAIPIIEKYSFDALFIPPLRILEGNSTKRTFADLLDDWEPRVKFAGILGGWYDDNSMKSMINRQRGYEVFMGMEKTFWWFCEHEEIADDLEPV